MGKDGNPKTFGFFTGNLDDESLVAVSPTHLRNIKPEHKRVLQVCVSISSIFIQFCVRNFMLDIRLDRYSKNLSESRLYLLVTCYAMAVIGAEF